MGAIHDAVRENDVVKVKQLIQEAPSLMESIDEDGRTPLLVAARNGCYEAAEILISSGANVNVTQRMYHNGRDLGSDTGVTPLHYASNFNHARVVGLLLEKGADVNARTSCGKTPLAWGKDRMKQESRQLLLSKGGQGASAGCGAVLLVASVIMASTVTVFRYLGT